ncbi:MAG TPA: hypothetical protein VGP93_01175 [Polyangiaceae bacterium]|nr:hypothetical protein [Polyangiaceae bacterium]
MQAQENYQAPDDTGAADDSILDRLSSLYAMEASAFRSYEKALASPYLKRFRLALRAIRDSHEERMNVLADRLRLSGGELPQSMKIRESLLALLEDAALALGTPSTAFSAFDRGEAHILKEYQKALDTLSAENRDWVQRELLSRHIGAHAVMNALKEN